MGARVVRRTRRVHDGKMLLLPKRLECRHGRMEAKEAVKIDHVLPRNGNARPHAVIRLLAMWHHDVESIGRAALEKHHQALLPWRGGFRGVDRAGKKTG